MKVRELHSANMFEDVFGVPETEPPGHAVLDTGASESVGTPQAIQQLIDRITFTTGRPCQYSTDTSVSNRVAFRLADGSVKRPYSLVKIETPRFGSIGIFVLEGMQAPILLSVREMRRRGMLIDFQSGRALVSGGSDSGQELIELAVTTNSRGHLLVDLASV